MAIRDNQSDLSDCFIWASHERKRHPFCNSRDNYTNGNVELVSFTSLLGGNIPSHSLRECVRQKFCELEIKTIYIGILEMTWAVRLDRKKTMNTKDDDHDGDENKGPWREAVVVGGTPEGKFS